MWGSLRTLALMLAKPRRDRDARNGSVTFVPRKRGAQQRPRAASPNERWPLPKRQLCISRPSSYCLRL